MREIEFRAKNINDQWRYGYLERQDLLYDENYDCSSSIQIETLGQYTGLTDKNGTKIFEGDVVKVSGVAKAKIIWNNEDACFAFDYGKDGRPLCLDFVDDTSIEVIGNIYDNKELLEENK